jgi:protein O-mannosyl-transferase
LALLAKETAVIFSLVFFLHAFCGIPSFPKRGEKQTRANRALLEALPYLVLTVAYLAVRLAVLKGAAGGSPWISLGPALATTPSLFLFYLRHLVLPLNLSIFYDFPVVSQVGSFWFWLPLAIAVAILVGLWIWYARTKNKNILAASQWLLLPLVPVLYIRNLQRDDFVHDRYLYLPVLAISVLIVLLGDSLSNGQIARLTPRFLQFALGGVVAILAIVTVVQARTWESNLSLYTNAYKVAPKNSFARNNLASEYAGRGRYLEAKDLLKSLVTDRPDLWLANYNFGYANYRLGNLDLAEEFFRRAIEIDPQDPDQYVFLGTTYFKENRPFDASEQIQKAIARRPDGTGYHFTLGIVYLKLGQLSAAKEEMQKELHYHPENAAAQAQIKALDQRTLNFTP